MELLSGSKIYLCGQVENSTDAVSWREHVTKYLHNLNKDIIVWDPLVKPQWMPENTKNDSVAVSDRKHLLDKTTNKSLQCIEANYYLRKICKQLANKCDIMIANITSTFTWGSIDELEIGIDRNIPIFLAMPDGIISAYGIAGIANYHLLIDYYIHETIDEVLDMVKKVNNGEILLAKMDPEKWLYLSWHQ